MARLLVQYPTLVPVQIDGTARGQTNRIVVVDPGPHTITLEGETTTPPSREVTIPVGAAPNDVVRVGFAPADRPVDRFSPLYCRYNGFLLGQFLTLAFDPRGKDRFAERRARMLEFLGEVGVAIDIPEEPVDLGSSAHADLLTGAATGLMAQSRELTEFMLLGSLLTHHGILAESDPATAQESLDQISWIREKHNLPAVDPGRFIVRDTGRGVDDVLSPSLAYLAEAIEALPAEPDTAFVIMPFKPPYASYFASFYRPSLEEAGFRAFRAWGGLSNEDYCDLLLKLIAKAGIVWADVSELNHNVMYEVGAAHALGKLSMIVVDEATPQTIPANIGHDAVVKYSTAAEDWPRGTVLLMAAMISSLSFAAEQGHRLRVPPDGVEAALEWVGQQLRATLVPPEARAAAAKGQALLGTHDYADALPHFDEAITLGLDDALTHLGRGIARVSLEQYAAAEEDLTAAVDDSDTSAGTADRRAIALYFRGLTREAQDNLAGARADYDLAIELGYDGAEIFERRAGVREQSGDAAGATADRERAIALAQEPVPEDEQARRNAQTVELPIPPSGF